MTITISSEDPRFIRAVEIAAGASQWLKCRTRDGRKVYGVPSQRAPGRYYLVDSQSCTCADFDRNGQSEARRGHAGENRPCKHVLAVRLHCELVKAQQTRRSARDRGHLSLVRGGVAMGYVSLIADCGHCGRPFTANPDFVPSLRLATASNSFSVASASKPPTLSASGRGLQPIVVHPLAYEAAEA